MIRPKLPLMPQQEAALAFAAGRGFYALLMEQGTGKTAVEIYDAARRFAAGDIGAMLVLAPNGVQTNWLRSELPKHMPDAVPWAGYEFSPSAAKRNARAMDEICDPDPNLLRVAVMNWEALITVRGMRFAERFCSAAQRRLKIVADESHRIKNPSAKTTRAALKLRRYAAVASVLSGTPVLNAPWDAFSQFEFLKPGLLGTTSYVAFRAEYAELLPPSHGVLRHIADRRRPELMRRFHNDEERVEKFLAQYMPQIPQRDPVTDAPKWRNLDRLAARIAPHAYRVTKRECLALPDKVYTTLYFRLTPKQAQIYERLAEEFRLYLEQEQIEQPVARLVALTKLAQVTSGFTIVPNTTPPRIQRIFPNPNDNPKLATLGEEVRTCVEENGEQLIIWARFREELAEVAGVLRGRAVSFVEYHGGTSKADRAEALERFRTGRAAVFLSQQQAGGTGLTLIGEASVARTMTVIYYSNTWRLADRVQSEDRAHRIGQDRTVRYVDIMAAGTVDEQVGAALRNKSDVAAIVTGDKARIAERILNFDRV